MDIETTFNVFQDSILLLTLATLLYMLRKLWHDHWYLRHALPLIVYSAHVMVYYLVLVCHDVWIWQWGYTGMAWSIALRLHGAIMVLSMARTVILCPHR